MFLLQIAVMFIGLLGLFYITVILAQAVAVSLLVLIDLWEFLCAPFVFLRIKLCRENETSGLRLFIAMLVPKLAAAAIFAGMAVLLGGSGEAIAWTAAIGFFFVG